MSSMVIKRICYVMLGKKIDRILLNYRTISKGLSRIRIDELLKLDANIKGTGVTV